MEHHIESGLGMQIQWIDFSARVESPIVIARKNKVLGMLFYLFIYFLFCFVFVLFCFVLFCFFVLVWFAFLIEARIRIYHF